MVRHVVLLLFALHPSFARPSVAQDTLTDTLRSGFRLSGNRLRRLPVDDPRHALVLIPGVRLTGPDIGVTPTAALLIRGSAAGRSNVYVDGAPLRFQTLGGAGVGLAPNAIADVSVLTGVTPAFLGDASGGVIAYETRSGGERLAGDLRWDSDEPFSDASSVGYNRIEGVVGGPIARGGQLTFFLSSTLQGQRSSYRGLDASTIPAYMPVGIDTTVNVGGTPVALSLWQPVSSGLRRPLDWSTARRAQAKLLYRYGARSSVSLTLLDGDIQQRSFPGQVAVDSGLYGGRRMRTGAAIINWQHELGTWGGGPLRLDVNLSVVGHRDMSGPLDTASAVATRDPSLGIAFTRLQFLGSNVLDLPTSEALVRGLRVNSGLRGVPFFGAPDAAQTGRFNPYGLVDNGWLTQGIGGGVLSDVAESRLQGRWNLSWRASAAQEIKAGVDAEDLHISSYTSDLTRQVGTDLFTARPKRLGVFAEDRVRLGDAAIDAGIRYDRINPGGDLPNTPAYISSSGSALWNPNAATDDTAYVNSVARVFRPARNQSVLSPRIQLSYDVRGGTTLRLAYSRTMEPPTWGTFFTHSNSDLSFTNVFELFGRDVDFAVAGLVEAGVRSAFGPAVLDLAVYRKDRPTYAGFLTPFPDPRDTTKVGVINTVRLFDNANVQGLDLNLDWRHGWLTAVGTYSLAHTTTRQVNGIISTTPPYTEHSAAVAVSAEVPEGWKRGTFLGSASHGVNLIVFARLQSGARYSRLANNGAGTVAPDDGLAGQVLAGTPINGYQLPSSKELDLRVAKSLRAAGRNWTLYLDARNLLNFSNLKSLFAETGDTANARNRERTIGDPTVASGEYAALWNEAQSAGALAAGNSVDLSGCASWGRPADCVVLTRVERRFGNGDKMFTLTEQQRTFNAFYHDFFGAWRFFAPGRTIRIGMELAL